MSVQGVVRPVDAAGLVLIRDGGDGPEILMGRRHRRSVFLPDIYVFPGGRVDPADSRPSGFPEPIAAAVAGQLRRGGCRRDAGAFLRAAIRETFEETGLLLAAPHRHGPAAGGRELSGEVWQAFARIGATPHFAGMDYICRAITPTGSRRRYNTRFFLAEGSHAAGTLVGNGELEDLAWWPVAETARLPIVDVTEFVLGEALRRWRTKISIGSEPPPLLCYRNDILTLRHAANAASVTAPTADTGTAGERARHDGTNPADPS